jgi:hypothetical protein
MNEKIISADRTMHFFFADILSKIRAIFFSEVVYISEVLISQPQKIRHHFIVDDDKDSFVEVEVLVTQLHEVFPKAAE